MRTPPWRGGGWVPSPALRKQALAELPKASYVLKVGFAGEWRVHRVIEIGSHRTLDALHDLIFRAFDREEEHMYAFFMNNKPWDESAEYGRPGSDGEDATRTEMGKLKLKKGRKFCYVFDFGDEWWHEIEVLDVIENGNPKVCRIAEKKGKSPPQYPDAEE